MNDDYYTVYTLLTLFLFHTVTLIYEGYLTGREMYMLNFVPRASILSIRIEWLYYLKQMAENLTKHSLERINNLFREMKGVRNRCRTVVWGYTLYMLWEAINSTENYQ